MDLLPWQQPDAVEPELVVDRLSGVDGSEAMSGDERVSETTPQQRAAAAAAAASSSVKLNGLNEIPLGDSTVQLD